MVGSSDKLAAYPVSGAVTPEDLTATLYHQLGAEPDTLMYDQQNRPFSLVDGEPIETPL